MGCVVGLTKTYRERVRKAELAFNEVEKRARKENKLLKKWEDGENEEEPTYGAGLF